MNFNFYRNYKLHTVIDNWIYIWKSIPKRKRKKSFITILFMLLCALLNVLSAGSFYLLLNIVTTPNETNEDILFFKFLKIFNPSSHNDQILFSIVIFIFIVLSSALVNTYTINLITKLSWSVGNYFAEQVVSVTLDKSYIEYTKIKSSKLISQVTHHSEEFQAVFYGVLQIITSSITCIATIVLLFTIDFYLMLFISVLVGIFYFVLVKLFTSKISIAGANVAKQRAIIITSVQQIFGAFRDIKLNNLQEYFLDIFSSLDRELKFNQYRSIFLSYAPRYLSEGVFFTIAGVVLLQFFLTGGDLQKVIPILGTCALCFQKMLPLLNLIFSMVNLVIMKKDSILMVRNFLDSHKKFKDIDKLENNSHTFKESISLMNLNFAYKEKKIINNVNFEIKKGNRIGIKGPSGSGKSTLLDLISGLLEPTGGQIIIDGKYDLKNENKNLWFKNISYVSQKPFLLDGTIIDNIIFNEKKEKELDLNKINKILRQADLYDFVYSLPDKYFTEIGENGSYLSGGQIQRLAISRALYTGAKILILDEITSALDLNTEQKVMRSINKIPRSITMIIVSHREETLNYCDKIFELENNFLSKPI